MDYDIALIKLAESVELDEYVQLACIPDENDLNYMSHYLAINTSGTTLGWNPYNNKIGTSSLLLSDIDLNIFPISECYPLFPNTLGFDQLICAGMQNVYFI